MQSDASALFSWQAGEFDTLVKKYKVILPRVHHNLTEKQLQQMAEDSAYMQMHMEEKI